MPTGSELALINNQALINSQLDTLGEYALLSQEQHNDILTSLQGLRPTDAQLYSQSLSYGLPHVTQGVIDLVYASQSGDPLSISIASLGTFSGFITMATPMLGPVAPVVSALSGMLATILGQFLEQPPTLQEELGEALNKFQAEEKEFALGTAADEIWAFVSTLETSFKKGQATAWEPLDLRAGPEIKAINDAWQWLSKEQKQSGPHWGEMLSKTCEVFTELLRAVTVGVGYPSKIGAVYLSTDKENITPSELMTVHLQSACLRFLQKSRQIKPALQNRGMLFQWNKAGNLWAGDHIEEGTNAHLGGVCTAVAVAVSQKWMGSAYRPYHLLRLNTYPPIGTVLHGELRPPYNGLDLRQRPPGTLGGQWPDLGMLDHPELNGLSDVWGMVGGDHRLDTTSSIGPEKGKDRIYFYAVKGPRTINGYVRDNETRTVTRIYGQDVDIHELKWVRVVQGPEAVPGDPDDNTKSAIPSPTGSDDRVKSAKPKELPGILRNVDYLVYGGNQSIKNNRGDYIYVDSRRSPRKPKQLIRKDGFVPGPWGGAYYYGLGVDQRYVWVHAPMGFACATHASVMRCLEGKLKEPTWMYHYMRSHPTLGKGTGPKGKIMDLCPCDDGSLVVCLTEGDPASADGGPIYTVAYHVNLKSKHIALQRWTPCGGGAAAYRTCKVPLFCWPWLGGLMKYVEQTYPEHAKRAR